MDGTTGHCNFDSRFYATIVTAVISSAVENLIPLMMHSNNWRENMLSSTFVTLAPAVFALVACCLTLYGRCETQDSPTLNDGLLAYLPPLVILGGSAWFTCIQVWPMVSIVYP